MDRLLAGTGGSLSVTTYGTDGEVADVDGLNVPSVVVRDSAGVSVSTPTGTRLSTGVYGATLSTTFSTLDLYTVTWTWPNLATRTTQFEMVGSFIFSDAELRAFDPELLISTPAYSPLKVRDVREAVEERFYTATGVSFTRRGRREFLDGDGSNSIFVSEHKGVTVISTTIDGSATTDFAAYERGRLVLNSGRWAVGNRNVGILYEHGFLTPPSPVKDAAMRYARYLLVPGVNKSDERLISVSTEMGVQRWSVAGRDGFTGLPDVDAVLAGYNFKMLIG